MTVNSEDLISVRNLTDHTVGYKIEELNCRRNFAGGETKRLTAGELRSLYYQKGGKTLLTNFLSVANQELREEFGVDVESPEYDWTQEDIDDVLLNKPIEYLQDALDFGPQGIVDTIVDRAVTLKIPDANKREAIFQATGFSVQDKIEKVKLAEQAKSSESSKPEGRRVSTTEKTLSNGRRVKTLQVDKSE